MRDGENAFLDTTKLGNTRRGIGLFAIDEKAFGRMKGNKNDRSL